MFRLCVVFGLSLIGGPGCSAQTQASTLVQTEWCRNQPRAGYKSLERIPVSGSWFEAYRVAPGVIAVYEPHQWEETVMYLITGTRRAVLLDTGMGIGDLRSVVRQLTPLPVIVVNSHTHPDHTGDNWQFDTVFNLDTPYTRENARGGREIRNELDPGKLCGPLPAGFNPAAYSTRPWTTAKWLHDGDTIALGGRTLQVLATPGHAPDALCLFDQADGLLFTGDTYYPGPIYVFGKGADAAAYARSAVRLAGLAPQVRLVLGAHNEPVSPPSVLPEISREFADIRSGSIKGVPEEGGILRYNGPQLTFYIGAPQSAVK